MNISNQKALENVDFLIEMKCHRSAEIVIHFALSFLDQQKHNKTNHELKSQLYKVLGDVYLDKSEYNQSQGYYQQSLISMSSTDPASVIMTMNTSINKPPTTAHISNVATSATTNKSQSTSNNSHNNISASDIKYNIAMNYLGNKDIHTAIKELESIPSAHRNIKVQIQLAKLYLKHPNNISKKSTIILLLKNVLLACNSVIETVEMLINLGVNKDEILTFCNLSHDACIASTADNVTNNVFENKDSKSEKENNNTKTSRITANHGQSGGDHSHLIGNIFSPEFYAALVSFLYHARVGDHININKDFMRLNRSFVSISTDHANATVITQPTTTTVTNTTNIPLNNVYLCSHMACAAYEAGRTVESLLLFQAIRKLHPLYIEGLDKYGELLFHKYNEHCSLGGGSNSSGGVNNNGNSSNQCQKELYKLANEVLTISIRSPIGWLLMALACESLGETEKTLSFIEKAIQLDPLYVNAYCIKGQIFMKRGLIEQSASCFVQAHEYKEEIISYVGIVETYYAQGNSKPLLKLCQEILVLYPNSHSVLFTVGKIYCDPQSTTTVGSSLNTTEAMKKQQFNHGVKLLVKTLRQNPTSVTALHVLVEALLTKQEYNEAITILKSSFKYPGCNNSSKSYVLLGKCYILTRSYGNASEALQFAVSLANKQNIDAGMATTELERLDSIIKEDAGNIGLGSTVSVNTTSSNITTSASRNASHAHKNSHSSHKHSSSSSISSTTNAGIASTTKKSNNVTSSNGNSNNNHHHVARSNSLFDNTSLNDIALNDSGEGISLTNNNDDDFHQPVMTRQNSNNNNNHNNNFDHRNNNNRDTRAVPVSAFIANSNRQIQTSSSSATAVPVVSSRPVRRTTPTSGTGMSNNSGANNNNYNNNNNNNNNNMTSPIASTGNAGGNNNRRVDMSPRRPVVSSSSASSSVTPATITSSVNATAIQQQRRRDTNIEHPPVSVTRSTANNMSTISAINVNINASNNGVNYNNVSHDRWDVSFEYNPDNDNNINDDDEEGDEDDFKSIDNDGNDNNDDEYGMNIQLNYSSRSRSNSSSINNANMSHINMNTSDLLMYNHFNTPPSAVATSSRNNKNGASVSRVLRK